MSKKDSQLKTKAHYEERNKQIAEYGEAGPDLCAEQAALYADREAHVQVEKLLVAELDANTKELDAFGREHRHSAYVDPKFDEILTAQDHVSRKLAIVCKALAEIKQKVVALHKRLEHSRTEKLLADLEADAERVVAHAEKITELPIHIWRPEFDHLCDAHIELIEALGVRVPSFHPFAQQGIAGADNREAMIQHELWRLSGVVVTDRSRHSGAVEGSYHSMGKFDTSRSVFGLSPRKEEAHKLETHVPIGAYIRFQLNGCHRDIRAAVAANKSRPPADPRDNLGRQSPDDPLPPRPKPDAGRTVREAASLPRDPSPEELAQFMGLQLPEAPRPVVEYNGPSPRVTIGPDGATWHEPRRAVLPPPIAFEPAPSSHNPELPPPNDFDAAEGAKFLAEQRAQPQTHASEAEMVDVLYGAAINGGLMSRKAAIEAYRQSRGISDDEEI